jgi:hypothetical protein
MARSSVKRQNQGAQVIFYHVAKSFGPNVFQSSSKRRKVATGTSKHPTAKGKERASEKPTIQLPTYFNDDDMPLSDQDLNLLDEYGEAAGFLDTLDHKGIARCVNPQLLDTRFKTLVGARRRHCDYTNWTNQSDSP